MLSELLERQSIGEIFEQVVTDFPNNVAVSYQDKKLSYDELNSRAEYLAEIIMEKGVKRGDVVAMLMGRTPDMVVAMIAIIKCGAAYYPVDKNNPVVRNRYCLDNAQVSLILTDSDCSDLLEEKREELNVTEKLKLDKRSSSSLNTIKKIFHDKDDKVYVMFTSGSTGDPKGVVVPSRAVVRLVKATNYITIDPQDTIFQFAPLSFDASTFEIWGALLNGATLALYSGLGLDPNLFARELKQNQVSILWLTAALFHLFATRYKPLLSSLRVLLAGGDVLNPQLISNVLDEFPHLIVINGYGPTENTTFTCCHQMTIKNKPSSMVPIGLAVSGSDIHILDEDKKTVLIGEVGELYTSGKGVALGYLNQSQGSDTFFNDSSIADGLIYKTGDLVRQNELGEIEFVGRIDNQVKIRGFRVSLEEIRNSLMKLNVIDDVVVKLEKFETGDQRLVAYVQLTKDSACTGADIKKILTEKIPSYMVPDFIQVNRELPINQNGKIDSKKLVNTF